MTTTTPQKNFASLLHRSRRRRPRIQRLLAVAAGHGRYLYFELRHPIRDVVLTIPEERSNREHRQNGG